MSDDWEIANSELYDAPLGLKTFFYRLPTSSDVGTIIPRLWRSGSRYPILSGIPADLRDAG